MEVNLIFKIHRKAKIEENPSKYLDADEEYKEYARGPRSIYWVTNKGKVLSSNWSGIRVMSLHVANDYKRVQILGKMLFVHRLVAQLFIPNDDTGKIEVNHKDNNTLNNCVDNLEWVSPRENSQYKEKENAVLMIDAKTGKIVKSFNSGRDAAKYVGVSATNIFRALKGIYKVVGGYCWKYKNNNHNHNYSNKPIPILQIDPNTFDIIGEFPNLRAAANSIGVGKTCIHNCIKGYSNRAGGYIWRYKKISIN